MKSFFNSLLETMVPGPDDNVTTSTRRNVPPGIHRQMSEPAHPTGKAASFNAGNPSFQKSKHFGNDYHQNSYGDEVNMRYQNKS